MSDSAHDRLGGRGRLDGEVALVTGSTAGLGTTIAEVFAAEGARVVVTGRNPERGAAVVARVEAAGGTAAFVSADLTDPDDRAALVDRAQERFGPVTVLVNNAVDPGAIAADGAVADVDERVWEAMFATNVVAVAALCRLVIPGMIAAGHGSIVNVSSRAAERASRGLAAYTASKGALNALTRSISVDYAGRGVRCNTVQPGYILNDDRDRGDEAVLGRVRPMHLTRLATARDVAAAALFLASSEAEVITGVTLPVDGGSMAARGTTLG